MFAVDYKNTIPISSSDTVWSSSGSIPAALRGKVAIYPGQSPRIKDWASALVPYIANEGDVAFDQASPQVSEIFRCPTDDSDGWFVGNNISSGLIDRAPLSYGVNADITSYDDNMNDQQTFWGFGQFISPENGTGGGEDAVAGDIDGMVSASSTMFFADGGTNEQSGGDIVNRGDVLMYTGSTWITGGEPGTLDALYNSPGSWARVKLPIADNAESADRHRNSMNVAFADGHGSNVNPSTMDKVNLSPYVR